MLIPKQSKISILGAGISGISLAIILAQKGYKRIQIYQKDLSFDSRKQGYGLTILQGKSALKRLGVLQQAKKHNSSSKAHYIFNHKGQILGFYGTLFWDSLNGNRSLRSKQKGLSMHIPRQSLRKVLLDKLYQTSSTNVIKWNHTLHNLVLKQSITMHFSQLQSIDTDILIGCDGANSIVRKYIIKNDTKMNYLNILIILGICGSDHPLTKQRVFQTADGRARLFSMPFIKSNPNMNSMWQLSVPLAQEQAQSYSHNPQQLKKFALKTCQNWHDPIPSMIAATHIQNILGIPAYDRQPELSSSVDKRVILVGDSGHPMCPFKGQGANQALLDAVCLGDMIDNTNIEDLNQKYQKQVFDRVRSKVLLSRQRAIKYHSSDFIQVQNFLYPRIDKSLIELLCQNHINYQSGEDIQDKISKLMKQNGFLI